MNRYTLIVSSLLIVSTSCVKEQETDNALLRSMEFDSFVEKGTKAAGNKLEEINTTMGVWGVKFKKGTVPASSDFLPIFQSQSTTNPQTVAFQNNSWVYSPKRYWDTACNYHFYAVSPHDLDAGCYFDEGKIWIFNFRVNSNVEEQVDVLVAARKEIDIPGPVEFIFSHALSRVNFKVKSGIPSYGTDANNKPLYETIEVTKIALRNVFCEGGCSFMVTGGKVVPDRWSHHSNVGIKYDDYKKEFANPVVLTQKDETKDGLMNLFLIPWDTYSVLLDIEYYVGDQRFEKTGVSLPSTIAEWEPNVNYTYTLVLNPYGAPISFGPITTDIWSN